MTLTPETYALAGGALIIGSLLTWLICSGSKKAAISKLAATVDAEQTRNLELTERITSSQKDLEQLRENETQLKQAQATLKTQLAAEQKFSEEKQQLLKDAQAQAQAKLGDTFKALSADALKSNQEQFLKLAETSMKAERETAVGDLDKRKQAVEQLVTPVSKSLEKVEARIIDLEKAREGAYASLKKQVQFMAETQQGLQKETSQLVKALRQPTGRGQWGEMQLRRVVEMAGMQERCDFDMQVNVKDDDGKNLRPDLVVSLPGGQKIVVDSKAPMDAYLDALETDDDSVREVALARHANQVRTHIKQLSSKKYQDQFETSPEFVVLFLPNEAIFSAALTQDSGLIEQGVDQGVILATPTTLIALLRAVAYGWRQEALTQNAQQIAQHGRELHKKLTTFTGHLGSMGNALKSSVNHYNKAVGSFERTVMPSARKFEELEAANESSVLNDPNPVSELVRDVKDAPALPDESNSRIIEPFAGGGDFTDDQLASSLAEDLTDDLTAELTSDFEGFTADSEGDGI